MGRVVAGRAGWLAGWGDGQGGMGGRVGWQAGSGGGPGGGGWPGGRRGMDLQSSKECSAVNIVAKNIQPPTKDFCFYIGKVHFM